MRARVRVTDLDLSQWDRLHQRLRAQYDIPSGAATVCAEFEFGGPQGEVRHVQMPVQEFSTVMQELTVMRRPVLPGPYNGPKGVADAAVIVQSTFTPSAAERYRDPSL